MVELISCNKQDRFGDVSVVNLTRVPQENKKFCKRIKAAALVLLIANQPRK
jgi:hypothetical protein